MSISRADGVIYLKGAVEVVLGLCASGTEGAAQVNEEMAARGLSVLAVALGKGEKERDLQLLGLVGIADPPRTEVIEAIRAARDARIKTVMITGDHPATAQAIARELGIVRPGDVAEDLVHARATPEDKLTIVRSWKTRGAVVANLVTDGTPALALVTDPTDADVLTRPPRAPNAPLLGRPEWTNIAMMGLLQAAATLGVFVWALRTGDPVEARSLAFSTLVFGELFRAFAARSPTRLIWEVGFFTNWRLLGVVIVSLGVQVALHHIPATQSLFQIGTLSLGDWGLSLLVGLGPVSALELSKLVRRWVGRTGNA